MSFFKRLFGRPDGAPSHNSTSPSPTPEMSEGVKQLLFHAFGSRTYDDVCWIGQHQPEQAKTVFRGLEYIEQAAQRLFPLLPDAPSLTAKYVGPSVSGLRAAVKAQPGIAMRFFVNSVEFQARIEHAVGTLQAGGVNDGASLKEWLVQEQAAQSLASAQATFFNAPLSLSLAQDSAWTSIDASPRTRMLLWGTLSTASVFAAHLLHHLKLHFSLPSADTQGAVFAHLRAAWLGYTCQVLDENRTSSERAVKHYCELLLGDAQMLDVYGMHLMNVCRAQMYQQGTQAENYEHFAALLLPYAPQVRQLNEAEAKTFFEQSHLLPLIAAETQWLQKVVQADLTEGQVTSLNQNLNAQVFTVMRQGQRPELMGFKA